VTAIAFAIPGDLARPTGGYAYDRHLLRLLPDHDVAATHLALPGSFPNPSDADLSETSRLLLAEHWSTPLLIDGLAYGAFPTGLAAGLAGRVIALCHHPLALETGTPPDRAAELKRLESAALGYAAAVIVTGEGTRDLLVSDFGVEPGKITVAVPGVARSGRASESPFGAPVKLLAVGSLSPRKGYDVLLKALASIAGLPWTLTLVGAGDEAGGYPAALRALAAESGLAERITWHGALSDAALDAQYRAHDLFVMASHYEGYGMVLTEALARGLPIVTTLCGPGARALPEAAAQKVPPGDVGELAGALAYLIGDAAARRRHADAAWAAADSLPRWEDTARIVAEVCLRVKP
jgi:glycosyltransferase involved in cell wall biosynthesis